MKQIKNINPLPLLWSAFVVVGIGLLIARAVFPDMLWMTILLAVAFVGVIGALIQQNRQALKTRQAAIGLNSVVTVLLVICIVAVINFIAARYPAKLDLTKNQVNSFSDQTTKLVKGLKQPVKAVLYQPITEANPAKVLMDNLKDLNPKFEVEYVDGKKESVRVAQNGIKTPGTLQLITTLPDGKNRDVKIEGPTEEKVANGLIKLLKEKSQTVCAITGHGERSFTAKEPTGYEAVRKALANQTYEVKDFIPSQEAKIDPTKCDAIAIVGPTKQFFEKEAKMVDEYLDAGGRAVIALDVDAKGGETAPELLPILAKWHVKAEKALVIDPIARMQNSDVATPVTANYSRDNPITKELQTHSYYPMSRPLQIIPGAPAGIAVQWLVKLNPTAWGETNFDSLKKGGVQNDQATDIQGPIITAIAVEGKQKDSKATRPTRLVVFGSANIAANSFQNAGSNLDLFANSFSWVLEDENLISIRPREEGSPRLEILERKGMFISIFVLFLMPLAAMITGIVVWIRRRRL